jgi:hypothetical protein
VNDTCGTCGGEHRTDSCTERDTGKVFCMNCKSNNHASWNRLCPKFITASEKLEKSNTESTYRYFLSKEPWTWQHTKNPWTHQPSAATMQHTEMRHCTKRNPMRDGRTTMNQRLEQHSTIKMQTPSSQQTCQLDTKIRDGAQANKAKADRLESMKNLLE